MNDVEVVFENIEKKQKRLEELGLTKEAIEENKKLIKEVDASKAKELGKELVKKISSKDYNEESSKFDEVLSLIKGGADLSYISIKDNTPLILAARKGYLKTFITLLKFGADVNHTNKYGTTPIMSAARHGNTEILDIAILVGGDVNTICMDGDTALMQAKRHGQQFCYDRLIKANARIGVKNYLNQTGRDIKNIEGDFNISDDHHYAGDEYIPFTTVVPDTIKESLDDARQKIRNLNI